MKYASLWIGCLVILTGVYAKLDFLSDYHQSAGWREVLPGENYGNIEQLARYLSNTAEEAEEEEEEEAAAAVAAKEAEEEDEDEREESETQNETVNDETVPPPFAYKFPDPKNEDSKEPSFAVDPSDPRFYGDFSNVDKPSQSDGKLSNEKKKKQNNPSQPLTTENVSEESSANNGETKPYSSAVRQIPVTEVEKEDKSDIYFTAVVAGCCAAAVVGVVVVGISCYRFQKNAKAAADVEYPAYGVTGPNKDISPTSGDRRLAQSAQMYHYQHQKQQIIAMESRATNERHGSISDAESDEENEEGDYTVYECPGLASTGEMEVKNPLFQDDPTPASPAKQPIDSSSEQTRELPK